MRAFAHLPLREDDVREFDRMPSEDPAARVAGSDDDGAAFELAADEADEELEALTEVEPFDELSRNWLQFQRQERLAVERCFDGGDGHARLAGKGEQLVAWGRIPGDAEHRQVGTFGKDPAAASVG